MDNRDGCRERVRDDDNGDPFMQLAFGILILDCDLFLSLGISEPGFEI